MQSSHTRAAKAQFQSTLPAGEATFHFDAVGINTLISIHASRGGSDYVNPGYIELLDKFQSTLPAGEATAIYADSRRYLASFQSTLPAGEAT